MYKLHCKVRPIKLPMLNKAEGHNRRMFYVRGTDLERDESISELVKIPDGVSLKDYAIQLVNNLGIDMNSRVMKRTDRNWGLEYVFTVTDGFKADFEQFYKDCLEVFRETVLEAPIMHAVIHYDEGTPHMHVIILPITEGRLDGTAVMGYTEKSALRNIFLFDRLSEKYNLSFPVYLNKAAKKQAAELVLKEIGNMPSEAIGRLLEMPIEQAVYARPEPFMHVMGIDVRAIYSKFNSVPISIPNIEEGEAIG